MDRVNGIVVGGWAVGQHGTLTDDGGGLMVGNQNVFFHHPPVEEWK